MFLAGPEKFSRIANFNSTIKLLYSLKEAIPYLDHPHCLQCSSFLILQNSKKNRVMYMILTAFARPSSTADMSRNLP